MSMRIVIPKNIDTLDALQVQSKVMKPFSDILVDFVNDVSKSILKSSFFKQYPELMALAFWMRKSHLKELKNYFNEQNREKILLGRGVVFHMAPSNVDSIFVYSWFISLLVGNSNVLRISNKENIQTNLLLDVISGVLESPKYASLQTTIAIIKYGHDDAVTKKLSAMADVRVIWGGDATVEHIRSIAIKPTATELSFADKFSFAMIKSQKVLEEKSLNSLIEKFYNDSFWFGQMACSSIRLVVWVGSAKENKKAKELFWSAFDSYVVEKNPDDISPADVVNKLVAECSMAIEGEVKIEHTNKFINRVKIKSLEDVKEDLHCGTGLFYELEVENFEDVFPFITKKHQTIAQYGFEKSFIEKIVYESMPIGVDRIVPIGKALDFSYIWDGYDLFRSFCREIEILK